MIFLSKLQIAVLFGGASSEHEVSRMSAATVLRAIDKSRYEVTPVGIKRMAAGGCIPAISA